MSLLAVSVAFAAGLFSFLSPCILPMLSVYFSLITGQTARDLRQFSASEALRQGVLKKTLAFVAGFGLVFTAAGAAAGQLGSLFGQYLGLLNVLGGLFVVGMGLVMAGVLPERLVQRISLRHVDPRSPGSGPGIWSSFVVGLFFAVACSHCIAPTLYSVLVYAGTTGSSLTGGLLMAAFSAGLAIPYILSGLFLGRAVGMLRQATGPQQWIRRAAGGLLILLGLLMLTGRLTVLTAWISSIWPLQLPGGM